MQKFYKLIEAQNFRYFRPHELLFKGDAHGNRHKRAYGKNTNPPEELWENIIPTIRILDELRYTIGAPIILTSVYRSPAYNRTLGGKTKSMHIQFNAVDFVVRDRSTPTDWAAILKMMRAEGRFRGGIGVYSSYVHLDTRGRNADW